MISPSRWDTAAQVGLLGHGGIRDSDVCTCVHFGTHCECLESDRHRPLCLVRVEADAAAEELAAVHSVRTDLFLAMDTGRDP